MGGRAGRGRMGRMGGGFGFAGTRFQAPVNDREVLESQLEGLRRQTAALEERLQGLDKEEQEE